MTTINIDQVNFASGEISPKARARFQLPIYQNGLERSLNYIMETQGPARFRNGSFYVHHTRLHKYAKFKSFQFNDEQAYLLEFTEGYIRFYKDEGVIVEDDVTYTAATATDPVVITATAHGYSDGDEVYISGDAVMTEINGKYFLVANSTANDFEITNIDGTDIDGSGYTAGTGGTVQKIVEITCPYLETEIDDLQFSQNADNLTIVHNKHDIRRLTRSSHIIWTLATFSRTSDPFPSQAVSGVTQANPGVVTYVGADSWSNGDIITFQEVAGMVELNGGSYKVANLNTGANTFEITDLNGIDVDTTGFTAYSSGGTIGDYPAAVANYESRIVYGGTLTKPESWWASMTPDDEGATRYDDFTAGTDADDPIKTTLAPTYEGKVDVIKWLAGTSDFLGIGTFGGVIKATGDGVDQPLTPGPNNIKAMTDVGSAAIGAIPKGNILLYVQRDRLAVRSIEFDVLAENFIAVDRNLVADHITETGIKQIVFQEGRPDLLVAVRTDGVVIALTFKAKEDVSGWHTHKLAGTDVKVLSAGIMPRVDNTDQIWLIVERDVNSLTRRTVEFIKDVPLIPEFDDFFTGENNKVADTVIFENDMFEAQKHYVHLDSALTYDGSDQTVTVTPGDTTGTGITFTASGSVFVAADVGREIWKKSINGVGVGRAEITAYVSGTEVTCTIKVDFDNADVMAAGNWYFTTDTISNLGHLEGATVGVVVDGGLHTDETVSSETITLDHQGSMVHVGLRYSGFIKTNNLEGGGITGPAQTKPRNIEKIGVRMFNTLSIRFGKDRYSMVEELFRNTAHKMNRPSPLYTGVRHILYSDNHEVEKYVYIENDKPLPCIIQGLDIYMDTVNN